MHVRRPAGEIFPRARVPALIRELRARAPTSPADITVWDWAADERMLRFVLDPPMVQHLGAKSLLSPERKKSKSVWSVQFEDLDAKLLAKQHEDLWVNFYA